MRIESLPSPNFEKGRMRRRCSAIVLHTTDGSLARSAAWLTDPASGVSAHWLVGLDGRAFSLVDERDTAFHAGKLMDPDPEVLKRLGGHPNLKSIGIEFEDGGDPGGVARSDAQYAKGARLIRAASRRWHIPLDRAHVIGHRELRADKTCPGNLDLDRLIEEATRPEIVCLLPVRNGAAELPGWLAHAHSFCDAVVALDDGSTDGTGALLEEHPLVARVISNPRRDSYVGWNDAENRQRLLEEAMSLSPTWIVQIDVDERLALDDATALRDFLEDEAIDGCAYGLMHLRMWQGLVDPRATWVYRVFAAAPGLRLPQDRPLHFAPVPATIPRAAWLRTTIRLQHFGAADAPTIIARRSKYGEADPAGAFPAADDSGMDDEPSGPLVPFSERDQDEPILVEPATQSAGGDRPTLAVLLPVRNAAGILPAWLSAVDGLADTIIALDDGSTDETAKLLTDSTLVSRVLSNPVRETYAGWDEPRDRQRLLDAAAERQPRFVMFLDVDERLDTADAAALRDFLEHDALPRTAYGFRVHRMLGPSSYDKADLWVYRLFAWAPDQRLSDKRLHAVPVPDDIPPTNYSHTTVRIMHFSGSTADDRASRYAKYRELDPSHLWQPSYEHILEPPGPAQDWQVRPEALPVVLEEDIDPDAPILSAVIIARDDADRIEAVVRSVVDQETDEPSEVIVVVSGSRPTAEVVAEAFPEVTLIEFERPVFPGAARNAGLRVARGDYVSFPGSHVEIAPGSLQRRIDAHSRGYPMVTGSILNGTTTPAGWANYLLDHSSAMPGVPAGELDQAPAHCSYERELLLSVGGFPEDIRAGEDTAVNNNLFAGGFKAWREPGIALTHRSRCDTPARLLRHHFERGRSQGRLWFDPAFDGLPRPSHLGRVIGAYVPRRISTVDANVRRWGGWLEREALRRSRWILAAAATAAWLGLLTEAARQRTGRR